MSSTFQLPRVVCRNAGSECSLRAIRAFRSTPGDSPGLIALRLLVDSTKA